MHDIIIIGGGPGGYMAAERAGHAGLNVLLIEKQTLGGVCLNEGCIPSKTLLHSAKIYDSALGGEAYGITIDGATLDHKKVIHRKNKVVETLVRGVTALMKANKVTVIYGEAQIVCNTKVKVNDEIYDGKHLVIATGSTPIIPPIEIIKDGLIRDFVLTNREILDLEEIPDNLVVIGGGVVGLEMASYYNSAGSKVTVIEKMDKIGGAIDNDIATILLKSYEKKGIDFKLGTRVSAINGNVVVFDGGEIEADKVLLSMGRKPRIDGFGLENTDVFIENGAIKTDKHGKTSVSNIYAVGDVNGRYMLAHAAYREAEVAVNHILGKHDAMRYDAVPSVIYTSPEVAFVGETEETAKEKGIDYAVVKLPMVYSGRYLAENASPDGISKVLIDKNHRKIIGVHLIGSYSSEIILSACIMIEKQMQVDDVKDIIFPHPTVGEVIRESIFRF